ncbi:MAG TPA: cytochrome c oxidase assembly protein [Bryobacteraceae bacterium]|nr:cytochrome c oxidase assembly protein [Bryobacteraceae bacterium]
MTTGDFFRSAWVWRPVAAAGCMAILAVYAAFVRFRFGVRSAAFFAGVALVALALFSPMAALADNYLFSVHMARHILLVLVVPALLVSGLPSEPVRRVLRCSAPARIERTLRTPAIAWTAGIGAMAFWHIPAVFNAALASGPLHMLEELSMLLAGTIYWWPILSPVAEHRLRPIPEAAAYLFVSCLACTAIGIVITFAPPPLYTPYAAPRDPYGILTTIRGGWGISPALDQQIGGVLMWVPCCFVYLTAIMAMFARWYGEEEKYEPVRN